MGERSGRSDGRRVESNRLFRRLRELGQWLDAAYGSVAGFALGALVAATLLFLRRRTSFATVSPGL